jgi:hypothetical protein
MRCYIRESSSQVEGETVREKIHTVRSVTTGWATTAVVWGVDDITILEGKTPRNSRVRSITASKTTIIEASLNIDICYYFVVLWSNFQETRCGCNSRDWQTNSHLYLAWCNKTRRSIIWFNSARRQYLSGPTNPSKAESVLRTVVLYLRSGYW